MVFQSTLPYGSDVSEDIVLRKTPLFQSMLPYGSDVSEDIVLRKTPLFQSMLPYGSDRVWLQYLRAAGHFNPRSLAGATEFHNIPPLKNYYFNPRSLAGATDLYWPTFAFLGISIHAPSRERLHLYQALKSCQHFNPRSLAGATDKLLIAVSKAAISIHAPLRERHQS